MQNMDVERNTSLVSCSVKSLLSMGRDVKKILELLMTTIAGLSLGRTQNVNKKHVQFVRQSESESTVLKRVACCQQLEYKLRSVVFKYS